MKVATSAYGLPPHFTNSAVFEGSVSVLSITPNVGPTTGGDAVTISGSSFTGATSATVGGYPLSGFTVVDDNTITGATHAHASGAVDVSVYGLHGVIGTLTLGYTYAALFLFHVDFSLLSLGGHPAATFATQCAAQPGGAPLVFARSFGSTVQTSPDTVISGLAANDAAIGSPDGTKIGLVIEPPVWQLISSTNSPRDLNDVGFGAWQTGGGVGTSVTSNAAVSPDGQTKASFCTVGFNGYSPYTVFGGRTEPFVWSIWRKSTNSCRQFFENYDSGIAASTEGFYDIGAGSAGWTRHAVLKPAGHFLPGVGGVTYAFGVAECQGGLSAGAPGGPAATSLYVDLMQLQMGTVPTEAIEVGDTHRHEDQLSITNGASLFNADRMRFYAAFYPKFATTEDAWFNDLTNILLSGVMTKLYFWADAAAGTGAWFDRGANKLKINDAHGHTYTSSVAMTWARQDFVEIFFEVGNSQTTHAHYRVNGGAWIDLGDGTAMQSLTPAGAIDFFWNGTGAGADSGSMLSWLKELRTYGIVGVPSGL